VQESCSEELSELFFDRILASLKKQRPLPLQPFAFGDLPDVILTFKAAPKRNQNGCLDVSHKTKYI